MKVGLNLIWLVAAGGGIGRYALELVPELAIVDPDVELTLFTSRDCPPELRHEPWADAVRWCELPVTTTGVPWHLPAQLAALPVLAIARRLDVVHGLANVVPVHVPGVRSVVTLHDLVFLHEGERWEVGRAAHHSARLSLFCARHADRVLTISEWAAEDMAATIGLDRAKIDVAIHGVRQVAEPTPAADLRTALDLPAGPVVLCVAQKRPYKGHAVLIEALARLDGPPRPTVVLPGAPTPYEDELRALAERLGVAERVRFPGWVSEQDLEGLYRLADAVVLPSRHEGFGLPVLEAMRCGTPVACSDRTALPEVAGDATLLFDPDDVDAVAESVRRLLGDADLAADLAARGRARAHRFTWRRSAEATLASYRRALAQ